MCSHLEVTPLAKPPIPTELVLCEVLCGSVTRGRPQNLCTRALCIALQYLLPVCSQSPPWTPEHTDWPEEASNTNKAAVWLDPKPGCHLSAFHPREVTAFLWAPPPVLALEPERCA